MYANNAFFPLQLRQRQREQQKQLQTVLDKHKNCIPLAPDTNIFQVTTCTVNATPCSAVASAQQDVNRYFVPHTRTHIHTHTCAHTERAQAG
jgi:hypothetical protein